MVALSVSGCGVLIGVDDYRLAPEGGRDACTDATAVYADGKCVKTGVRDCGSGFAADGRGGCEPSPSLPAEPCYGQLSRPGAAECKLPVQCADTGVQDNFQKLSGGTYYVRAGEPAGGKGTLDQPFGSISEALSGVADTTEPNLVIWDGEYRENVVVAQKVLINGDLSERRGNAGHRRGPESSGDHLYAGCRWCRSQPG